MTDKGTMFGAALRNIAFRKGENAVNLQQEFEQRGVFFPKGEMDK